MTTKRSLLYTTSGSRCISFPLWHHDSYYGSQSIRLVSSESFGRASFIVDSYYAILLYDMSHDVLYDISLQQFTFCIYRKISSDIQP
jgi:hypothetical protein